MENHTENVHGRLVPDPFLILVNSPKQLLHAKNYFKNKIMKEDYQKALKKLTIFFLSNPVSFNGQSSQKQKGSETTHQFLFRLQSKFRKIPLLVIHYLTKFDNII